MIYLAIPQYLNFFFSIGDIYLVNESIFDDGKEEIKRGESLLEKYTL